jgi:PLP dependent protein
MIQIFLSILCNQYNLSDPKKCMSISENLVMLKQEIGSAQLVVATKNRSVEQIFECYKSGQKVFGENRVQEAIEKIAGLPSDISWHMIGHLQGNKVREAVELFDVIQSVDSEKLLLRINEIAKAIGKVQRIMLQVNISNDSDKFGLTANAVEPAVKFANTLESVELIGLMTITSQENRQEDFQAMKKLFDGFNLQFLSMGMSDSYEKASSAGANMVRVGSVVF